jgi:O-antigen/teichoic acid export membrane protein
MALLAFAPGYLVPMFATLFGIYAITRILSPAEYGSYAFVMSIMLLVQSGLLAWIDLGAKRFFERAVQSGKLAAMCMTLYLGLVICAVMLLASCAVGLRVFDVPAPMAGLLWIAAAVVITKEISMVSKTLELAALSRTRYMLMECCESLIGVGLGLWLCWYFKFGAAGILYGMMVGALVVVAFDARFIVGRLRGGTFDLGLQKQILTFSTPIAIAFFVEFIMSSSDRMMVQFFLGAHELGIYAVAYSIAERAVTAVFMALGVASYPLVVRALERGGRDAAMRQAGQNVEVLMAIAIPAWGGFTVASGHIATVLAGPAYEERVASLLPLAGVAVFLYSLRTHYFSHAQQLTNRTWSLLTASGPAVVINVAMNALLLPSIGLMGAVWARLAAYLVALGISVWLCQRQLPLPFPVWGTAKASLATLVMCGFLRMVTFPAGTVGLVSMILCGILFYGVIALVFDLGGLRSMWLLRRRDSHLMTRGTISTRERPQ